jgi:hypothetical protein
MGWVPTSAINRLVKWYYYPCAISPLVYVETALPALMKAFFTFNRPDVKHIVHQATGHSWLCSLKSEVNELHEAEGAPVSEVTRGAFAFIEATDVLSWYAFIAGVTVDGLANWTSAAMHMSPCNPHPGANYASGADSIGGWPQTGDWQIGPIWGPHGEGAGPSVDVPPKGFGAVAGNSGYVALGGMTPVPANMRTVWLDTGEVLDEADANANSKDFFGPRQTMVNNWNGFSVDRFMEMQVQFIDPPIRIVADNSGYGYNEWRTGS